MKFVSRTLPAFLLALVCPPSISGLASAATASRDIQADEARGVQSTDVISQELNVMEGDKLSSRTLLTGAFTLDDSIVGTTAGFGRDTVISGNGKVLVVGSGEFDGGKGFIDVYDKDENGSWSHTDSVPGTTSNSGFGSSLGISYEGTIIAVGAPTGAGFIQAYSRDGSGQLQERGPRLAKCPTSIPSSVVQPWPNAFSVTTQCNFGYNIELSLDGNVLGEQHKAGGCGGVFAFDTDLDNWVQRGETLCHGSYGSMVMSGDGNIVGFNFYHNNVGVGNGQMGTVRTWKYDADDNVWTNYGTLIETPQELASIHSAQFGWASSMSYDGKTIAMGAERGNLFIYNYVGNDWVRSATFTLPFSDNIFEMDISGNGEVIAFLGAGKVYIYHLEDSTWSQIQTIPNVGSFWALELSADGSVLAFGGQSNTAKIYSDSQLIRADYKPYGSASGDPHFVSFRGVHFSWHGACDSILSRANDLKIEVHIRTKRAQSRGVKYSYIASVAAKIHSDVIEVQADGSLLINGALASPDMAMSASSLSALSGCTLTKSTRGTKHNIVVYDIDLKGGRSMQIRAHTRLGMLYVDMHGTYPTAEGLLGNSMSDALLGRDGERTFGSYFNSFGDHWQVQGHEEKLFADKDHYPQFPKGCSYELPEEETEVATMKGRHVRRRLMDNGDMVSREDAEASCVKSNDKKREFCIFDVMTMNDLELGSDPFYLS